MTDKNFVHGCVQRSEQELNPLSVTLFHTLQNWYHTQGTYGTVIAIYLLVDTSKNKPETKASSTDLSRTLWFSSVVHVVSATYSASTVVRETNS